MRQKFLAQIILVGIAASLTLTGCHHGNGKTAGDGSNPGGESSVPGIGSTDGSSISARPPGLSEGDITRGQFAAVYFDYDSARIKPSEDSKLQAIAAYMKSNPGKLVIEGHCDERGTAEYNRALGERRALAAREELVKLGADGSRITTISYGKDHPADMGHDESAWAKNRRDEFGTVNQ